MNIVNSFDVVSCVGVDHCTKFTPVFVYELVSCAKWLLYEMIFRIDCQSSYLIEMRNRKNFFMSSFLKPMCYICMFSRQSNIESYIETFKMVSKMNYIYN